MKVGNLAKNRIHVEHVGSSWLLYVDQKSVIRTPDRHWLRRFAVTLRKTLAGDSIA
ncbi:MAG: hypothetical protein WDN28_12275 [Chthoniobacter sp.]